jgi:hypothetical protein
VHRRAGAQRQSSARGQSTPILGLVCILFIYSLYESCNVVLLRARSVKYVHCNIMLIVIESHVFRVRRCDVRIV